MKEKINWEIDYKNLLEKDIEERTLVFAAYGEGQETGKKYIGSAYIVCDELDEIKDIEELPIITIS